jgi:hypothetical protein
MHLLSAVDEVKLILSNNRFPQIAENVTHEYSDKYSLAEFLVNMSLSSQILSFEKLGLTTQLPNLKTWALTRTVSLRFCSEETCEFIRKEVRKVVSDTTNVTEVRNVKIKQHVETNVEEWFWKFTVKHSFVAFKGATADGDAIVLSSKSGYLLVNVGTAEIKTTTDHAPYPKMFVCEEIDVEIGFLLANFSSADKFKFKIDRDSVDCLTPRRNKQIEEARTHFQKLSSWCERVKVYMAKLFNVYQLVNPGVLDFSSVNTNGIFVPVFALFEERTPDVLSCAMFEDANLLLKQSNSSIDSKILQLSKMMPTSTDPLFALREATFTLICYHLEEISSSFNTCIQYIEHMIMSQVVAAIGKHVTPADFHDYIVFHNRKFFGAGYRPKGFCYPVRRAGHVPEGVVSIESKYIGEDILTPIETYSLYNSSGNDMKFGLSASVQITFGGERHLHGWLHTQFSDSPSISLQLVARARQFSSYILLVGGIIGKDLFDPKYAIIIQNKDEILIPLLTETLPSPKEFKDAIASLSPEQKRFCKAFRSMQLGSTLFGVCIVQIKPQLEKVLNLPPDALTKEIQLTQDLMKLFIEYQIPSDLLSYESLASKEGGWDDLKAADKVSVSEKLSAVRKNVAGMMTMINEEKQKQIDEEARKHYL